MITLFLLLMVVLQAFYSGWLHRRLKTVEARVGETTPAFGGITERRAVQLIEDKLRGYARGL